MKEVSVDKINKYDMSVNERYKICQEIYKCE